MTKQNEYTVVRKKGKHFVLNHPTSNNLYKDVGCLLEHHFSYAGKIVE